MDISCGDNSVATKRNLVEILRFRHFSRHVVFDAEGDKFRNKRLSAWYKITVELQEFAAFVRKGASVLEVF